MLEVGAGEGAENWEREREVGESEMGVRRG